MKVTYKKLEAKDLVVSRDFMRVINPFLSVIESSNTIHLFLQKDPEQQFVHVFDVEYTEDEINAGQISMNDIVNEVAKNVFNDQIDGIDDKADIMQTFQLMSEPAKPAEDDNRNKIFYHLINGSVMYSDATTIDWQHNIEHISEIAHMADSCRALIRALLVDETVRIEQDGEEPKEIPVAEHAANEINRFFESNSINIDYSIFDKDTVTDRERLIVRLMDILTIHNELIMVSSLVNCENVVRSRYENTSEETTVETDHVGETS